MGWSTSPEHAHTKSLSAGNVFPVFGQSPISSASDSAVSFGGAIAGGDTTGAFWDCATPAEILKLATSKPRKISFRGKKTCHVWLHISARQLVPRNREQIAWEFLSGRFG